MPDITIDRANVNLALLDAELRGMLGAVMTGISIRGGVVVVHLRERANGTHEQQAKQIVLSHDPNDLTPEQRAQKARLERLQADRTQFSTPLNPVDFAANPLAQTLASRMAWLENEIRDLRDL